MGYGKWKPSKRQAAEFAKQMQAIEEFCVKNGIQSSRSNDSYYFTLNGKNYRVSNHAVEARNSFNDLGELKNARGYELDSTRRDDTQYIHASKTRIIDIYNNLKAGKILDGRGNPKIIKRMDTPEKPKK